MQMAISRFFIRLRLQTQILTVVLLVVCNVLMSKADVGLTHELKQQRIQTLQRISELENDSVRNTHLIDSLQKVVITLDAGIMKSYDETVARMADQKRQRGRSTQTIVYLALGTTIFALFLVVLLIMARKRVINSGGTGLMDMYRQLTTDFVHTVSAEKTTDKRVLRVNIVVVAGLVLMSISVIAFLLRTL